MSLDIQHSAFILHNIINRIVAYIDIKTQNRIPNPKPPTPNPPPPLFFFFFSLPPLSYFPLSQKKTKQGVLFRSYSKSVMKMRQIQKVVVDRRGRERRGEKGKEKKNQNQKEKKREKREKKNELLSKRLLLYNTYTHTYTLYLPIYQSI